MRAFALIMSLIGCHLPLLDAASRLFAQSTGAIEIDFRDEATDEPVKCRVKVLGPDGRERRVRGGLYVHGWNLVEGPLVFKDRAGDYQYQAYHGPQFSAASGGFTLDRKSAGLDVVRLPRHADLAQEKWYGGDLLCHVSPAETLRWLPAEDLSMAAVVTEKISEPDRISDGHGKWVHNSSYSDVRAGSGLVLHHWLPPSEVPEWLPSSRLLVMAKESPRSADQFPVHAEIQRMWARDVPIWLASGRIDSIQLLGAHLTSNGEGGQQFEPIIDPAPGRFRGPRRLGRLVENFYWQVLESGLRIAPSAGSGFGKTPSPLGYNRVYAYAPGTQAADWWEAVRAGRTFVTSGPLLRTTINGEVPGAVFSTPLGKSVEIDIAMSLTVADPVEYLDVIFNGQTLYQARLDEYAQRGGKIPPQSIRESGWLVVRVVTERDHTYRIASTAPYYFEIGDRPRISRSAVAFFQAWLKKSSEQIEVMDEATRTAARPYLRAADEFWQKKALAANVD